MSDLDSIIQQHLVGLMDAPEVQAEEAIERARDLAARGTSPHAPPVRVDRSGRGARPLVFRWSTLRRVGAVLFAAGLTAALVVVATRGPSTQPPKPAHHPTAHGPVQIYGANIITPDALVVSGDDVFIGTSGIGAAVDTVEDTTAGALVREIPGLRPLLATGNTLVATDGRSITEVDIASGRVVRTISGPRYHFTSVNAAAALGSDLLVDNYLGSTVTEVNLVTGALIRVLVGAQYQFNQTGDLAVAGRDLLVTNASGVTEVDIESGQLVRLLTTPGASFAPSNPSVSGNDLFVVDNRSTLVEFDLANGSVVRVIPALPNGFDGVPFPAPSDTVVDGPHLFVDLYQSGLVEYDVTSGRLVRAIDAPTYHPGPMALAGRDLLVAEAEYSVTEVDTVTGKVVGGLYGSSYDFASPSAELVSGDTLFVANGTTGLTEMDAGTGALLRVSDDPRLQGATALAALGDVVFVAVGIGAECTSGSVVEVSATAGVVLRVISGARFHLGCPNAIAVAGDDVFVGGNDDVTEIDARSGALVRVIPGRADGFNFVNAMAVASGDLLVASEFTSSASPQPATTVSEIDTRTGDLVKVLGGREYRFDGPSAMALSGQDLFITDSGDLNSGTAGAAVTEIDAATGALVRVLSGPRYQFDDPDVIAVAGKDLFVSSGSGGPVTEIDAATGVLMRVISPSGPSPFGGAGAVAVWHDRVYVSSVGGNTVVEFGL